jgi:hypothetical protein
LCNNIYVCAVGESEDRYHKEYIFTLVNNWPRQNIDKDAFKMTADSETLLLCTPDHHISESDSVSRVFYVLTGIALVTWWRSPSLSRATCPTVEG